MSPAPSRSPDASPARMPMSSARLSIAIALAASANDAPARFGDARCEQLYFAVTVHERRELDERICDCTTPPVDDPICGAQRRNRVVGDAPAAHTLEIETDCAGRIAAHRHERGHVLQHETHAADVCMRADRTILR